MPKFFASAAGTTAWILALASAYLAIAMLVADPYYGLMLTLAPIWAVLAVSWNIFSGYSGLMSFGHAAFFGLGAYTVALLEAKLGITPWIGIPVAALVGGLSGVIIGAPTFRLRGHYFALAMLAYPLGLLYVFEWLGLQEIAFPMRVEAPMAHMQFTNHRVHTLLAVAMLVLALLINARIARSRFGLSLLAIKQNELAAQAAGINPFAWKLRAIMLSGALAGAAGGLYAVVLLIVTPHSVFGMMISAQALIFSLFGGIGMIAGPVIGALVLVPASELLNARLGGAMPGLQGVLFGLVIILTILLAPEGILPKVLALVARFRASAKPGAQLHPFAGGVMALPVRAASAAAVQAHAKARAAAIGNAGKVVLDVRALAKSFGGLQAVGGVSFTVFEGEILGIIGPNGAGKTTLFNVLNGILPPSAGQVMWQGADITGLPSHQICRLGMGRTFQVVRAFARLTILQNVVVGAFVDAPADQQAYVVARAALTRVGLAAHADVLASGLTMMQLRLMELARCLASRPQLILLDEIFAGLGSEDVEQLMRVIQELRDSGLTVLIIEHTMDAMVRLADRLLVLDHGNVLAVGDPASITSLPTVIEAYLGKKWSARAKN